MSVRTNDPRPPEIFKPALCAVGVGCGKPYESICGKCNLAYCSDHLKAPHACETRPATRPAAPEPASSEPARSDAPQFLVGQQVAPGLVVVREETLERLRGPFTCGHSPMFVGGACAACHAEGLEKLDVANLQLQDMTRQRDLAHRAADSQEKDLDAAIFQVEQLKSNNKIFYDAAVTVVEKWQQREAKARLLYPIDLEPVMAFGHTPDQGVIQSVVSVARQRLLNP